MPQLETCRLLSSTQNHIHPTSLGLEAWHDLASAPQCPFSQALSFPELQYQCQPVVPANTLPAALTLGTSGSFSLHHTAAQTPHISSLAQLEQQPAFFLCCILFCFILIALSASGTVRLVCLSTTPRISSALAIRIEAPGSDILLKCSRGGKWLPSPSVLFSLFITWKGNQQQVTKNQLYYKQAHYLSLL